MSPPPDAELDRLRARTEAAVAAARLAEHVQPADAPHRERLSSDWSLEELSTATRAAVEATLQATGAGPAQASNAVEISANPKGARLRGKWWQLVVIVVTVAAAAAGVIFALHVWG